jgi:hypothetical protein
MTIAINDFIIVALEQLNTQMFYQYHARLLLLLPLIYDLQNSKHHLFSVSINGTISYCFSQLIYSLVAKHFTRTK